ncbi:MAG: NUDIX domain-containing protein [Nanoarchaeota archaeon]
MRKVVVAAVIEDKKILLVRKRETWIIPGGKPESGEGDLECLIREFREELPGSELKVLRRYGSFEGKAPHKGDIVDVHVYLAEIRNLDRASAEISEAKFVNDPEAYNLAEPAMKIIKYLRKDGLL